MYVIYFISLLSCQDENSFPIINVNELNIIALM